MQIPPADPSGGQPADPAAAAVDAAAPADAGSPAPAPSFDRDGWSKQYKDWVGSLEDATLKDMGSRFTGPDDLLKLTVEQRKELSTRIKVPDEKSTDEDRAKFRKAIGVPPEAKDYEVVIPEGMELSEAETTLVEQMREAALAAGVPKDAFKAQTELYFKVQKATEDAINTELKGFAERSQAELKKEYGGELEGVLNAGRDLIAKLGEPDFEWLLEQPVTLGKQTVQLGNHPAMAKFIAKLGKRGGEAQPGGMNIFASASDKQNAQKRIDEIYRANPPGSEGYKSPAVQKELSGLFAMLD